MMLFLIKTADLMSQFKKTKQRILTNSIIFETANPISFLKLIGFCFFKNYEL